MDIKHEIILHDTINLLWVKKALWSVCAIAKDMDCQRRAL